jgi:hypothetical protein
MKLGIGIGLAGGIMAAALWSHAGTKGGDQVTLSGSNIWGSMAAVRAGSGVQQIGCESYFMLGSAFALCSAQTATGTFRSCSASDSGRLANIRNLDSDSELQFSWDAVGNCLDIVINNNSYLGPKQP